MPALNEGRGVNPGDTGQWLRRSSKEAEIAQRRPGREPRRHAGGKLLVARRPVALNEGRGVNPGDTRWMPRLTRGR